MIKNPTILEEAAKVVDDRESSYGRPQETTELIATLWTAYLKINITPQEVSAMMILLKLARLKQSGNCHRDSIVDIAGYARLMERINSEQ